MFEHVDPFIGTGATDLPPPQGLAATWWWPKPQVGNTHPGATYPFGMVSACAYSGAYPTGYGLYELNTEGVPAPDVRRSRSPPASRHFQQSGTGAIRKYYNYFRVTPMLEPLDDLGHQLGADRRGRRARLLRGHAVARASAARSPSDRRARSTATRSRRTATPGWSSTSRSAAWLIPYGAHRPAAGPPGDARARRRPGRDRRRGGAAGRAPRVRQPATGASCSGTTGG